MDQDTFIFAMGVSVINHSRMDPDETVFTNYFIWIYTAVKGISFGLFRGSSIYKIQTTLVTVFSEKTDLPNTVNFQFFYCCDLEN